MYIHLVKSQTPQRNKCDSAIYILLCYFLTGRFVSSLKLWPRSWKSKVFPVVNWLTSGFVYATDCLWIANTCIPSRKGNTNQTSLKSFCPEIHFILKAMYIFPSGFRRERVFFFCCPSAKASSLLGELTMSLQRHQRKMDNTVSNELELVWFLV